MGTNVKLALKRLTRSDLTFLEPKFRTLNAGNQKSINLNADVLVNELFPAIAAAADALENEIPIKLAVFGPDGASEYKLARKIVKGAAYKNWRLNGEFVRDPDDQPGRFDVLEPDDLALIAFEGEAAPSSVRLIFLAKASPADRQLHAALSPLVASRSMIRLEPATLSAAIGSAVSHPAASVLRPDSVTQDLEDAALGDPDAVERVSKRAVAWGLTPAELAKARSRAEQIGRDGEAAIDRLLAEETALGTIKNPEWVSRTNAVNPYDFRLERSGQPVLVEVKTTTGRFDRRFHISMSELRAAALSAGPYVIYRICELAADGAVLRRSEDIRGYAGDLLARLGSLPAAVTVDSLSMNPSALKWGPAENLKFVEQA